MKNYPSLLSMDFEKGKLDINFSGVASLMIMVGGLLAFSGTLILISIISVMILTGFVKGFLQLAALGLIILPAGIVLLYHGRKIRKRERRFNLLTGILQSYRRIKLDDIAGKMDINVKEVEILIANALSMDIIRGFIDRNTEEFVLESTGSEAASCRSCGAPFGKVYLKGEIAQCSSCGTSWTV